MTRLVYADLYVLMNTRYILSFKRSSDLLYSVLRYAQDLGYFGHTLACCRAPPDLDTPGLSRS